MERKEILEIVNLALDIQLKGEGVDGFPYVNISVSNYGAEIEMTIMDNGFVPGGPRDGEYHFSLRKENSERQIRQCKEHLLELKERVSE